MVGFRQSPCRQFDLFYSDGGVCQTVAWRKPVAKSRIEILHCVRD
ncbi:hypothetical protein [Moraxella catarrhalis]|nr:hypothetical protein [Moraxella catarrhalis]